MEFISSISRLLFPRLVSNSRPFPYVHFVTRDYELPLQLRPILAATHLLLAQFVACLREIETTLGNSQSHDSAWGEYYAWTRQIRRWRETYKERERERKNVYVGVSAVVICFATILRLMYKMARKSNERKAVGSDESRGSSLPRTVIYRCWTAHEERVFVLHFVANATAAAIYTDLATDPCEGTRSW